MKKDDEAMLGDSGYERIENDFYETPEWVTEIILKHVKFDGSIWEPAAGKGAMVEVMRNHGYLVCGTDLVNRGHGFIIMDFLKSQIWGRLKNIVTNPPYGDDAEAFAKHALDMLPDDGKLVLVCRYEWLCAKKRRYLFDRESAFCKLIVLNKRPRWIKGSKGSPRHNYAIYVWDNAFKDKDAEVVLQ